jgi:hypothetical protein
MNIQDKCNCTSDECFHGKVKYTTALGLDLTLTNHMGNTTLNVRKASDVSIEGVTQLEHGQVRMHVSSLGKTQGSYKFARSTGGVDLAGSVALNYTPQQHHDQLRVNLELNVSLCIR